MLQSTTTTPLLNRVLIATNKQPATVNKPLSTAANSTLRVWCIDTKLPLVVLFTWFHAFMRENLVKGCRHSRDQHHFSRCPLCSLPVWMLRPCSHDLMRQSWSHLGGFCARSWGWDGMNSPEVSRCLQIRHIKRVTEQNGCHIRMDRITGWDRQGSDWAKAPGNRNSLKWFTIYLAPKPKHSDLSFKVVWSSPILRTKALKTPIDANFVVISIKI